MLRTLRQSWETVAIVILALSSVVMLALPSACTWGQLNDGLPVAEGAATLVPGAGPALSAYIRGMEGRLSDLKTQEGKPKNLSWDQWLYILGFGGAAAAGVKKLSTNTTTNVAEDLATGVAKAILAYKQGAPTTAIVDTLSEHLPGKAEVDHADVLAAVGQLLTQHAAPAVPTT